MIIINKINQFSYLLSDQNMDSLINTARIAFVVFFFSDYLLCLFLLFLIVFLIITLALF